MPKLLFILGSANGIDGSLSSVSLSRINRALQEQKANPDIVLMATGGFGDHFNVSARPHRAWVHQYLQGCRAAFDPGQAVDLMRGNTVEDALTIRTLTERRAVSTYAVATSAFHVTRCRYIFDCITPNQHVEILAADSAADADPSRIAHERQALAKLAAQGGVIVAGMLHPPPFVARVPSRPAPGP